MPKFARLEGVEVKETVIADELPPFHPDLDWRACPDAVTAGYSYDEAGDQWSPPVVSKPQAALMPSAESVTRALLIDAGAFTQAEWDDKKVAMTA